MEAWLVQLFPLCGLAVAEAERRMPDFNALVRDVLNEIGMPTDRKFASPHDRLPNGCARPYMAELALVGDGPEMYQVWVGGSPALTRIAEPLESKVKWLNMREYVKTLMLQWKKHRLPNEAFGDFAARFGLPRLREGRSYQRR